MQNKQMNRKGIGRRLLAYVLALCIGFSPFLTNLEPVQAETITETKNSTLKFQVNYPISYGYTYSATVYYENQGTKYEKTQDSVLNSYNANCTPAGAPTISNATLTVNGQTTNLTGSALTNALADAGYTLPTMTSITQTGQPIKDGDNIIGATNPGTDVNFIIPYKLNLSNGDTIDFDEYLTCIYDATDHHYTPYSIPPLAVGTSSSTIVNISHPSHTFEHGQTQYKSFTYQTSSSETYDPIIEEDDDLIKELGDPVASWSEGIAATWGKTTTNTIPSDGTITDNTLVSNNDADLSSDGTAFDRVGWKLHNYRVKDSTNDATFTDTSRRIIVKTTTAPNLDVFYANTTDAYGGEWVSQHASADPERQKKLDIKASTADPGTTYDTTIFKGTAEHSYSNANSHTIADYATESPTVAGEEFRAQLLGNGDHSIELSDKSGAKTVKIDSTVPTAHVTSSDSWATLNAASTDALSGADKTFFKFVPTNDPAPSVTDSGWTEATTGTPSGISQIGYYDVYTYATDNATNKSSVVKEATNIFVANNDPARITTTYQDDDNVTQDYTSGTWINKDIKVTVQEPTGFSSIIDWYGAIYEGQTIGATPNYKATNADSAVEHTYTADIPDPGLTLRGYAVDAGDTKLSGPSAIKVLKIDKQLPIGNVKLNTLTWAFDDMSTDQVNLSGIDTTKTTVAVMPTGSLPPLASNYEGIGTAILPAVGWYDVWVIATDNAGNKSVPVKALENVSRSGKDTVDGQDFMRGINEGALTVSDAKALGLAEGSYYGGPAVAFNDMVVDATELAAINAAITAGTKGEFPLTISTPASNPHINLNNMPDSLPTTATKTITVTLTDQGGVNINTPADPDDNSERIYGNDFYYGINNGALAAVVSKNFASVSAFGTDNTPMNLSSVTVDQAELDAINAAVAAKDRSGNPFPLTFETPDGTSVTVNVTLFDIAGPEVPSGPNSPQIGANNFDYGCSEPDLTESIAEILSSVAAKDGDGNDAPLSAINIDTAELQAIVDAQHAGNEGKYPLTFDYMGEETTITITLKSEGGGTPGTTDHIIANDFSYGLNEPNITDPIAKIRSSVAATDQNNNPIPVGSINVDQTELQAIQDAHTDGRTGEFPLTFESPDGTTVTITVTLYDHTTAGNKAEYIAANDFDYGCDEATLTNAIVKALSDVNGRDEDGLPVALSDIAVNSSEFDALVAAQQANKTGRYPLTFSLPSGTATTITVTLRHHGAGDPGVTDHITANDFSYGVDEADLTENIAKLLSTVKAIDKDGNQIPPSSIQADATELAAIVAGQNAKKLGPYPLTFETPDGTKVTITVTLKSGGGGTPGPGDTELQSEHITGSNFIYGIYEGQMDQAKVKARGNAAAIDKDGIEISQSLLTADNIMLDSVNASILARNVQDHPMKYSTPDGTSAQITIRLRDRASTPDQGKGIIGGNDFTHDNKDGALTADDAKDLSDVIAKDKNGNLIPKNQIKVDKDELDAINKAIKDNKGGTYPLTYTTADGQELTVMVTLKKAPTPPVTPSPDPEDPDAAQTGDTSNIYFWILLAALAGTAALVAALARKRKRNNA